MAAGYTFLLRQLRHVSSRDRDLSFDRPKWRFLRDAAAWRRTVLRGHPALWERPERATVIQLSYRRPWNIDLLLRLYLGLPFVERVILSHNEPDIDIAQWVTIKDPRLTILQQHERKPASMLGVLAEQLAADRSSYFLSVDDDLLPHPRQVGQLFLSLLKEPERVHGMVGQVFANPEATASFYHLMGECEVDVVNRAYAFTADHVRRYVALMRELGYATIEDRKKLPFGGDIVLSAASAGKPCIHDVGPLLRCPTEALPGIARFKEGQFAPFRLGLIRSLRRLGALQELGSTASEWEGCTPIVLKQA